MRFLNGLNIDEDGVSGVKVAGKRPRQKQNMRNRDEEISQFFDSSKEASNKSGPNRAVCNHALSTETQFLGFGNRGPSLSSCRQPTTSRKRREVQCPTKCVEADHSRSETPITWSTSQSNNPTTNSKHQSAIRHTPPVWKGIETPYMNIKPRRDEDPMSLPTKATQDLADTCYQYPAVSSRVPPNPGSGDQRLHSQHVSSVEQEKIIGAEEIAETLLQTLATQRPNDKELDALLAKYERRIRLLEAMHSKASTKVSPTRKDAEIVAIPDIAIPETQAQVEVKKSDAQSKNVVIANTRDLSYQKQVTAQVQDIAKAAHEALTSATAPGRAGSIAPEPPLEAAPGVTTQSPDLIEPPAMDPHSKGSESQGIGNHVSPQTWLRLPLTSQDQTTTTNHQYPLMPMTYRVGDSTTSGHRGVYSQLLGATYPSLSQQASNSSAQPIKDDECNDLLYVEQRQYCRSDDGEIKIQSNSWEPNESSPADIEFGVSEDNEQYSVYMLPANPDHPRGFHDGFPSPGEEVGIADITYLEFQDLGRVRNNDPTRRSLSLSTRAFGRNCPIDNGQPANLDERNNSETFKGFWQPKLGY
ncbi:hypothetical protein MMC25_007622 [Agyrium rufum]|nr:hypothetical protein [Agyrium rufum]